MRPVIVGECVDHRLPEGIRIEEHDLFPLRFPVALISLRDIQGITVVKNPVQRQKNTHVAEVPHSIHRSRLRLSVEKRELDIDVRIIRQQLRQDVIPSIRCQKFQIVFECIFPQTDSSGLVIQEKLIECEFIKA